MPPADNHIETNPQTKISPDDTLNYLILQRQANLIVELSHERTRQAKTRIQAWKARCAQHRGQHNSNNDLDTNQDLNTDTTCDEYNALVEMGPGIIAQVMLEYDKDRTGPWYKLMHQLVCERPMDGATTGRDGAEGQYERWRGWFEYSEHHEAEEGLVPEYLRRLGMV